MRNIYDIIEEQKAMVSVNICSYELNYIAEEFKCLQEGVGETVKNVVNKIIEFIKMVIRKIKELLGKVFGFFKTRDEKVQNLDNRIKQANKDLEEHYKNKNHRSAQEIIDDAAKKKEEREKQFEKEMQERQERYKREDEEFRKAREEQIKKEQDEREQQLKEIDKATEKIKDDARKEMEREKEEREALGVKIDDLGDLISKSRKTVVGKNYGRLKRRIEFLDKFERSIDKVSNMNLPLNDIRNNSHEYLHDKLCKSLFLKTFDSSKEMIDYLTAKELRDIEDGDATIKLNTSGHLIAEYCRGGSVFLKKLKSTSNSIISELEAVNDYLEDLQIEAEAKEEKTRYTLNNDPNKKTAKDYRDLSYMYDTMVRTVNQIFNVLITSSTAAYNQYTSIAIKITDDHCKKVSQITGKNYGV